MPYPVDLLQPGEQIVIDLRPHWYFLVPRGAIVGGLLVLLVLSAASFDVQALNVALGAALLVALVVFLFRYLTWHTTNFVLTSQRLIHRRGVIAKKGVEIPLDRINTVFFSQSVFERIIGSGDLAVESAGELGTVHFHDVHRPSAVQAEIYRQMEADEQAKRNNGPPASTSAESIPDQIEKLDQLRRQGIITPQEFEAKKAELLRRM